jgi:hypothetical protein
MGVLEAKIERLPPERRQEVEDFVDFLLERVNAGSRSPPGSHYEEPAPIILAGDRGNDPFLPLRPASQEPQSVGLGDLSFQKRRPDPDHLLEWIG